MTDQSPYNNNCFYLNMKSCFEPLSHFIDSVYRVNKKKWTDQIHLCVLYLNQMRQGKKESDSLIPFQTMLIV